MDYMLRDKKYQGKLPVDGTLFLHGDCKPIDQINFKEEDNQFSFSFDDECEGMCGN